MESIFSALLLALFCGFAGGVLAYVAIHWGHIRFQLGLDYRLSDLEGRVAREVKVRAANEHLAKKNTDKDLLEQIKNAPPKEELTMKNWRERAFTRS